MNKLFIYKPLTNYFILFILINKIDFVIYYDINENFFLFKDHEKRTNFIYLKTQHENQNLQKLCIVALNLNFKFSINFIAL